VARSAVIFAKAQFVN